MAGTWEIASWADEKRAEFIGAVSELVGLIPRVERLETLGACRADATSALVDGLGALAPFDWVGYPRLSGALEVWKREIASERASARRREQEAGGFSSEALLAGLEARISACRFWNDSKVYPGCTLGDLEILRGVLDVFNRDASFGGIQWEATIREIERAGTRIGIDIDADAFGVDDLFEAREGLGDARGFVLSWKERELRVSQVDRDRFHDFVRTQITLARPDASGVAALMEHLAVLHIRG